MFEFERTSAVGRSPLLFPPDDSWRALDSSGSEVARCAVWWSNHLPWPGYRTGVIGAYSASEEQAGAALLHRACAELRHHGCTIAIGPMDGNTWCSYRFVTESGDEPRFWLEPDHPPDWPAHFAAAGFRTVARYFSSLNSDLSRIDPRAARAEQRLRAQGMTIRPVHTGLIDPVLADADLVRLLEVTNAAFRHNLLFQPISLSRFRQLSTGLQSVASRPVILIAERREQPVGFVFAFPDACESLRSAPPATMVVRTLAALPGRAHAGAGNFLLAEVGRIAYESGFRRVIHAMVREQGHLVRLSSRHARVIRRYALFGKILDE